ncbi:MAG TPA: FkbM family methyltransferase [Candidatus Binataceae bacterium]|nr:FkbM family methyltransferase [Candidatus Binataceae bacterium]
MNREFIRQVGPLRWAARTAQRQFAKRVLKRDSRLRLPTGLMMTLPRASASATEVLLTNANVDWGAEALFAQFAERGRDALDIGAHVGYYALYLAPLVRRVYAFEPDPRNFEGLERNAVVAGNVEIVRQAVSSRTGRARLALGTNSSVSSLGGAGGSAIEVPVTTIDDFLAARPEIDPALIKTDMEGHDLEGLRGTIRTIGRFQPLILTECGGTVELSSFCTALDYSIFSFVRDRATYATALRRLDALDLETLWYKMLFLVPPRLVPAFMARCS